MAWALVQNLKSVSASNLQAQSTTVAASFGSAVTAGNRILLYVSHFITGPSTPDINTPTDNQGNAWTQLVTNKNTTTNPTYCDLWTAVAGSTGTLTITVVAPAGSGSGGFNELGWTAQEYSGLDSSAGAGCLDVSATGPGNVTNSSDAQTGTTAATHADNQLGVCMVADLGASATWTLSTPGGFTKVTSASLDADANAGIGVANKTSANGTAESAVWHSGLSNSDCALIAVIKLGVPAVAAPPIRPYPPGLQSPMAWRQARPMAAVAGVSIGTTAQPATATIQLIRTASQTAKATVAAVAFQTAGAAIRRTVTATQPAVARIFKDWSAFDPQFLSFEDCKFNLEATTAAIAVDATQLVYCQIRKCNFSGGRYAIRGQRDPSPSLHPDTYSTGVTVEDCIFGQQTTLSICNPSNLWRVVNNIFQPGGPPDGRGTTALAVGNDGAYPASTGLAVDANYFGKANTGVYVDLGQATGFRVTGNFIDGILVNAGILLPGGAVGGMIEGNLISCATGIDCALAGGAAQTGVDVDGNNFTGSATPVANHRQTGQEIHLRGNAGTADWTPIAQTVAGSVAVSALGAGYRTREGPDCKQGTITLAAGAATVSNLSVTAASRILLAAEDNSTTGPLRVSTRTPGIGFTISSANPADSGLVAYQIFEPVLVPLTVNRPATARVKNTATAAAQSARARIGLAYRTYQYSRAWVALPVANTTHARARILNLAARATRTATANISSTVTAAQPAVARLQIAGTATRTALSQIAVTATTWTQATATIATSTTTTATATIQNTATAAQTATATVINTTLVQLAAARIQDFDQSASQTGRATVQNAATITQAATARIVYATSQPAAARIQITGTADQPATATVQ